MAKHVTTKTRVKLSTRTAVLTALALVFVGSLAFAAIPKTGYTKYKTCEAIKSAIKNTGSYPASKYSIKAMGVQSNSDVAVYYKTLPAAQGANNRLYVDTWQYSSARGKYTRTVTKQPRTDTGSYIGLNTCTPPPQPQTSSRLQIDQEPIRGQSLNSSNTRTRTQALPTNRTRAPMGQTLGGSQQPSRAQGGQSLGSEIIRNSPIPEIKTTTYTTSQRGFNELNDLYQGLNYFPNVMQAEHYYLVYYSRSGTPSAFSSVQGGIALYDANLNLLDSIQPKNKFAVPFYNPATDPVIDMSLLKMRFIPESGTDCSSTNNRLASKGFGNWCEVRPKSVCTDSKGRTIQPQPYIPAEFEPHTCAPYPLAPGNTRTSR